MELSLILGLSFAVVALTGWVVAAILLRRRARRAGDTHLAPSDQAAALRGHSLHEQATAGQMAAMTSAQRQ